MQEEDVMLRYLIRDLQTGTTARFTTHDDMVSWAERRCVPRLIRDHGGWMATGTKGTMFKFWDGYAAGGNGTIHRFIIHRSES